MLRSLLFTFLELLVFAACAVGQVPTPPPSSRLQYGPLPEDLANALIQMARASKTPLIAELAQPLPKVQTSEGVPLNPGTLDQLVLQSPGYEWKMEGKVVHFYNKALRQARFNFLNLVFPRFTIPSNLSDFKLWFPSRAVGLLEGYAGEGGATSGFGDSLLMQQTLRRVTLENVSPRDVLFHVGNESPAFYCVLVFPTTEPTQSDAEKQVNWHWGSLLEPIKPIYTQPVPQSK